MTIVHNKASGLNKALHTSHPQRCAQVVSRAVNLIYVLSALVHPFMPSTSDAILEQLNAPARAVPDVFSNDILASHTIGKPDHLFKRIDDKMADVWRAKFGGHPGDDSPKPSGDATHVVPGMSKRKAAAAKKAAEKAAKELANGDANGSGVATPKSAEVLAWEQKIAEQGQVVRKLKGQPKSEENDSTISQEVEALKKLKAELIVLTQQQQA